VINREVLLAEINRIYVENKPMLANLPYKQRGQIMGFLGLGMHVIQAADESELENYAAFTRYFILLLRSGEDAEIPPDFTEFAKQAAREWHIDMNVDADTLRKAFKKLVSSPQAMHILDEVAAAFDKARTD